MSDLIKPSEFVIKDKDGNDKKFILSNFPAIMGREIIMKYPMAALPKVGDYAVSEEIMVKLMGHVAVEKNGVLIRLATRELIDNHCTDSEMLMKIEIAMMEKNYSFFQQGKHWDFLENLTQIFVAKISEMLTRLSEQSFPENKPQSTS